MRRLRTCWIILILSALACNLPYRASQPAPADPSGTPVPSAALASSTAPPPTSSPAPTSTLTPIPIPTLSPTPAPAATVAYTPYIESAACPMSYDSNYQVDCGYLVVPEDRTRLDSPMIRLAVAIYRSPDISPAPDPVVHLAGGPGGSSLSLNRYMLRTGFNRVLESRDVIFFDQRGTGYSQPRLDCPERQDANPVLLDGNFLSEDSIPIVTDAYARCRDRLIAQGIDLNMYTSAASAADINDLRRALGYPEINLFGTSYGTRLALTVMRDFPAGIRSVVLDSVYPPEQDLYTTLPANAQRSFDVFFQRCAGSPTCSASYPDLEARFYALADQLDYSPVQVDYAGYSILLTGRLLVDVLFVGLYNPEVTAYMPQMIADIESGDHAILRERLSLYFDPGTALGMQMSVQCIEEIPFGSVEALTASALSVRTQVGETFVNSVTPIYRSCAIWGTRPAAPLENQPVLSPIPALVLAGDGDPITPPAWGQAAADHLSNSYYYLFTGMGHWVARSSACAIELIVEFLANPLSRPSTVCQ